MNIIIIGHKKSADTRKAQRFFKERRIQVHFRDITEKGLTRRELEKISVSLGTDPLIDRSSKLYKDKGYEYMEYDVLEELEENPALLKTPIVRNGSSATLGLAEDEWSAWLKEEGD